MNYETLFQPVQIGNLSIKNRFVMPAMESGLTKNNRFTEASKAYFLARAKGGFGLIITDYMAVDPKGIGVIDEVGLWDDEVIENLKELTDFIHAASDTKIFAQLHHSGIMCQKKKTGVVPKGPSAIASPKYKEPVEALSKEEIIELIHQYGDAAFRAKQGGYDGVELHAAHGYLVAQFLSKFSNKRIDSYGGSYQNRFRFAKEIIQDIHSKCGSDFPISLRISAEEYIDSGNYMEDALLYAKMAEDAGVSLIHVSTGTGIGGNTVAPYFLAPGFNVDNAGRFRQELNIPIIAVGRINDPVLVEDIVKSGKADMVSLGRQSLCDPEFPLKMLQHRENEIFHCTGCMQRCYYNGGCEESDKGISCMLNPFTGKEGRWKIHHTAKKKNIAIIGAGPAGLEAGWILAKGGHQVSIYERKKIPGGNFRLAAVPPKKQDMAHVIYTLTERCGIYGAKILYQKELLPEDLPGLHADIIILATGSVPLLPRISGLSEDTVITADALLSGRCLLTDEKVLILGGGLVGCETAEFLHMYNNQIDIVDMADALAKEQAKRPRAILMERMKNAGIHAYLNTTIDCVTKDGILGTQNGQPFRLSGYTKIVAALGYRSNNPLEEAAAGGNTKYYVIGDAKRARDAKMAIYEAAKLAIELL